MAVADIHPGIADLEAFTLGTLDDASLAGVEAHVADCPICQERAAAASGDTLVQLLRRVHAQAARRTDTVAETAAQAQTPAPEPAHTEAVVLARDELAGLPLDKGQQVCSPALMNASHSAVIPQGLSRIGRCCTTFTTRTRNP